ncbi:neuropeptides capa receptor-like [Aplysia californica]|uniref:Neuropeptides capa receptor-like n=1 Tax=Aplysia californica TaxID=6500 RepID=A0ABM0K0W4_APLCA|nr:neuropeptides capa receptor-like [Aplysia californica]
MAVNISDSIASPSGSSTMLGTSDIYLAFDIALNCFGNILVSILGILGNTLNILVLRKYGLRDSTTILLFSLSVCDLLYVLSTPVLRISCLVSFFDSLLAVSIESLAFAYVGMFNRLTNLLSVSHIGIISVERFTAVYFPFSVSRIFTVTRTKQLLVLLYLAQTLSVSPLFAIFTYQWVYIPEYNHTLALVESSMFYTENYQQINSYSFIFLNVCGTVLTLVIVLFTGAAISAKLLLTSAQRKTMTSSTAARNSKSSREGADAKALKMIGVICAIFVLIFGPASGWDLYGYALLGGEFYTNSLYVAVQRFFDFLYTVNASVNFLIYVSMSGKFRATYKKLFLHSHNTVTRTSESKTGPKTSMS